ncbi:TPA: 2Fe-2S iron-sulfur cluster binding domain-containing protein, partial [Candidatus Woesearchaeota archaeon]|nr:2Fe-2S iron-sulfur cluster binding domain-containing protein [Candidatus Woesearchaeota archaeon]
MAILKTAEKQVELADGSPILDAAKELGVPFGCHSGICGTCHIEVEEGMENLAP